MARELIPNAGLVGLNKDLSQHELTINVWTDAENIRFFKGNVLSFRGHGEDIRNTLISAANLEFPGYPKDGICGELTNSH